MSRKQTSNTRFIPVKHLFFFCDMAYNPTPQQPAKQQKNTDTFFIQHPRTTTALPASHCPRYHKHSPAFAHN
uniref:Uncharacterized protein n=1 Tax=mine drainage metagenome TaxID=410659 RepID=E6QI68_9ZZZZ